MYVIISSPQFVLVLAVLPILVGRANCGGAMSLTSENFDTIVGNPSNNKNSSSCIFN